jgi:hypothetical protein
MLLRSRTTVVVPRSAAVYSGSAVSSDNVLHGCEERIAIV